MFVINENTKSVAVPVLKDISLKYNVYSKADLIKPVFGVGSWVGNEKLDLGYIIPLLVSSCYSIQMDVVSVWDDLG